VDLVRYIVTLIVAAALMSTLGVKCADTTGQTPESRRIAERIASLEAQRTNALTQKDNAHAALLASQLNQAREEQAQALRNQAAVLRVEQQQAIQQNQQAENTRITAEIERVRAEQHQAFQAQLALVREELERAAQLHQQQQAQDWTHQLDALRGQRDQAIIDLGEQLRADHARSLLQQTTQSALQLQLQLDAARAERGEVLEAQRHFFDRQYAQIRQEMRDAAADNRREIAAALAVQLLALQNGRDQALADLGNRLRAERDQALEQQQNQFAGVLNAAIANNLAEQERIRAQAQQDYEQQRAQLVQEQADARANHQRAIQDAAEAQLLALQMERDNDLQELGNRLRNEHDAIMQEQRQAAEALAEQQRVASEEQQRQRDAEIARLQEQLAQANANNANNEQAQRAAAGLAAQLRQAQQQRDEERARALAEANRLGEERERALEGQRQQAAAQLAAQDARINAERDIIEADQEKVYVAQLTELQLQRKQANIQAVDRDATNARLNALLHNRKEVLDKASSRLRDAEAQALNQQLQAAEQQRIASEGQRRLEVQIAELQQRLAQADANNQQEREAIQAQLLQAQLERDNARAEAGRRQEEHLRALQQQEQRATAQLERERVIRGQENEIREQLKRRYSEETAELRRQLEAVTGPLDERKQQIRDALLERLLQKEQAWARELEAQSTRVEAELALSLERKRAVENRRAQLQEELAEDRRNNNGSNQARIEKAIRELLDEEHALDQLQRPAQLVNERERLRAEQKTHFNVLLRLHEEQFTHALLEKDPVKLPSGLEHILGQENELFDRRENELSQQASEATLNNEQKREQHLEEELAALEARREEHIATHMRLMAHRLGELPANPATASLFDSLISGSPGSLGSGGPKGFQNILEDSYRRSEEEIDRILTLKPLLGEERLINSIYRTIQKYNGKREENTWGAGKESSFSLAITPEYTDATRTLLQRDHSSSMKNQWASAIMSAVHYVDITSLSEPESGFKEVLKDAIDHLAQKSKLQPGEINVRILFAKIPSLLGLNAAAQLIPTEKIVDELIADFRNDPAVKLNISVGTYDASVKLKWLSWNHSKIVASDTDVLFTGGHNLYNDYLIHDRSHPDLKGSLLDPAKPDKKENQLAAPIHDLSVGLEGRNAAVVAHQFVNLLWEQIRSYGVAHTFSSKTGKVVQCTYKNRDSFLPDYRAEKMEVNPKDKEDENGKEHDFISVGRLGFLKEEGQNNDDEDYLYRNVSDPAIVDLINHAKHAVFIAQQRLEPLSVGPRWAHWVWALGRQENRFNNAIYKALANLIISRRHVYILLSSNDPEVSGKGALNYCTDSIIGENTIMSGGVPRKLFSYFTDLVKEITLRSHPELAEDKVLRYLHILPTANGLSEVPNHSKVVISDNRGAYIGSSNVYDHSHQEFGVIVGRTRAEEILRNYFKPLWKASLKYWLDHGKRLDGKDPKFIK
jgi:phosphatidylserine/phosphatidylglycerophosphate/cardiolipin synthase-like enzyme